VNTQFTYDSLTEELSFSCRKIGPRSFGPCNKDNGYFVCGLINNL